MSEEYSFRPFQVIDLDLVESWLKTDDVARWYPDPDYIDDLEDQLKDARICQRIALFKGAPFAYVQDYDIHGWDGHHLSFLPAGSRGMDTFIGRTEMLGKGHGSKYLGAVAELLFSSGIPALGIDPAPENRRAIRAYQNIGFRGDDVIETDYGRVRLMSLCC